MHIMVNQAVRSFVHFRFQQSESRDERATCAHSSAAHFATSQTSRVSYFFRSERACRVWLPRCVTAKKKPANLVVSSELLWCNNPVSRDPRQRERCCASAIIHHWSHKRNRRGKENLWRLVNLIPVGACTVSHHSISCASFCECSLTSSPIVATTYPVSLYIPTVFQYTCAVVCRPALRKSLFVHILCVSVNIFN